MTLQAQQEQLEKYVGLLAGYNKKLNLLSRGSTIEDIRRHVDHCMALTQNAFPPGSIILDVGTGGGLPGIPLALAFPDCSFVLVDSVTRKIMAVRDMARTLGLTNVDARAMRMEEWVEPVDYVVSRATAPLATLWSWTHESIRFADPKDGCWKSGLVCLKGGDLSKEIEELSADNPELSIERLPLTGHPHFKETDKVIVTVSRSSD